MKSQKLIGNLMLLLAALFWGTTFVAQSEGMEHMGPLTYQAARSVLGGAFLIPVALASDAIKKKKDLPEASPFL